VQRDDDRDEHWEEGYQGLAEWNDHEHHEKEEVLGSGKNSLMFGEDGLEVERNRGCLNGMNGMEFCNNARMTFFQECFYVVGTDNLRGSCCDELEIILLSLLVELHGKFPKIHENGAYSP
jgi:hypothetical protein